ncbi:MAG TPA: type I-E CRISPR-associated protein Cse2/CasB [Dissulfurispiraceae bacterium]|nr:type I-E CRISPR-associated protein Cse2/CasB [Dissulfurispiraceae bacterium]
MEQRVPDFMSLYDAWMKLAPGPKAELKRVSSPDELLEIPAFYRLFSEMASEEWGETAFQRLVFCLPCIKHTDSDVNLGAAIARDEHGMTEKRLFQVMRSEFPNDMIQLRQILKMVGPVVNWSMAAKQLWNWNERSKSDLLEDFFLNQTTDKNTKSIGEKHAH